MTTQAPAAVAAMPAVTTTKVPALERTIVTSITGRRSLAVLRLATGFIFLWAFLDKAFGLGFSTPAERAWINGGAPAQGFLNSPGVTGPLQPWFQSIASPLVDWIFMAGLLAIGAALMLGVGLRIAAGATTAMMLLMYLAEWPFAANGASTNPLVDYHIIYALVAIVVAVLAGGDTWGLGEQWKKLTVVQNNHWLI